MNLLERLGLKNSHLSMENLWLGTLDSLTSYSQALEKYTSKEFVLAELPASRAKMLSKVALAFPGGNDEDDEENPEFRPGHLLLNRVGDTAVLSIRGSLVNGHSWWHALAPNLVTSYDAIRDAASIIKASADIKKVLVSVSSPGGMAQGVDSAGKAIKSLARSKKMVGHTDNMAASAGYWLLSNVPEIKASRMAEVGSIGVIAVYTDFSKAAEDAGIKFHVFSAGKYKAYGFEGTEFTDEEKSYIQGRIDKTNNFFLSTVAKNRNLKLSEKEKWADAQVFYAGEAKAVGLVDELADLEEALGGINPAVNSSGGKSMTISEEKLAKISAGESPETVLTPTELEAFYDSAEADVEPAEVEASEQEPVQELEARMPEQTDNVSELSMKLGRAEAKLEAMQEKLDASKEHEKELTEQLVALKEVAQKAVSNLQVALQEPRETRDSVSGILEQYTSLTAKLSARLPQGRVSSDAADTKEMDMRSKASVTHPFRPN